GAGPCSISPITLRCLPSSVHTPKFRILQSFACHFYANHHFTEFLSLHTLAHSFAPRKKSTLLFSIHSALFVKNTRVGEGSMLTIGPSSERSVFPPQRVFSFHLRELRVSNSARSAPNGCKARTRRPFHCLGCPSRSSNSCKVVCSST